MSDYLFLIVDQVTGNSYYLTNISGVSGGKSSTITRYNTTSGTKISDHLYVNPRSLRFKINTSHIAMSPCKEIYASGEGVRILSVEDLKNIFDTWLTEGRRLNITTFEDYYTNLVLTDIQVNESEGLSAWSPSLVFSEVRTATAQTIQLDFPADNKEKAASNPEENTGMGAGDLVEGAGGAVGGALLGAAIGSLAGPVGAGVGAAIGAVAGFFYSLFTE